VTRKTSAIGREKFGTAEAPPAPTRFNGFTLIELMVVLAIMVLIASVLPLALNRALPARRVAVAADKLVADIRWLQTQSTMLGRPARISVLESGYRLNLESTDKSREVALAKSMALSLRAREDGRVIKELLIYPDGTSSAGRFEVSDSGRHAIVEIGMLTGRARRIG
jgi:general secretion pathway protein H